MTNTQYIKDSLFDRLKAELPAPKEFLFADDDTFYTMLRNIFRGKWILVTGPSGCWRYNESLSKVAGRYQV
jgi:hypothetical protein